MQLFLRRDMLVCFPHTNCPYLWAGSGLTLLQLRKHHFTRGSDRLSEFEQHAGFFFLITLKDMLLLEHYFPGRQASTSSEFD